VSRKSERLVNLTIALLATRHWLTKSEIFQNIEGYDGEPDAKERMFERDKEELRKLGIEIEVGTFDPLFEDEVGYRIRPESYQIRLSDLTSQQLALIASATQSWRGAILDSQASAGLAKLKALGIESDVDGIPINPHQVRNTDANLVRIIDALAQRKTISFQYRAADNSIEDRAIDSYGVGTKNGYWYVAGHDISRRAMRLFRLDRITSDVKEQGKSASYEIPKDFEMGKQLESRAKVNKVKVKVRIGKGDDLRKESQLIESGEEWDLLDLRYAEVNLLVRDILWHRDDVYVLASPEIQALILSALASCQDRHG
jgi:proteasome accessory factor B